MLAALAPACLKGCTTEGTDTNGGHGSLVHGRTTTAILSCAYKVHSRLGPGLLERTYRTCLTFELAKCGCLVETEKQLPVGYEGLTIELGYPVDLLVDDVVIVEVKAVEKIMPVHRAQLLSYLRLSGRRVGLLINFNVPHLKEGIHRKINGFGESTNKEPCPP